MNPTFLHLVHRYTAAVPSGPHFDVAPPTGPLVVLGLGAIVAIGVMVTGVIVVSILVIRAVKKNQPPPDNE